MHVQNFAKKIALLQAFLGNFKIRSNNEKLSMPKKATICNSVYLAQELLELPFGYQFTGFGRNGVVSSDLCADYDDAQFYKISHTKKDGTNDQVIKAAHLLSNFTDDELAEVAQLLWNEGVFLSEDEKIKANEIRATLLKQTL